MATTFSMTNGGADWVARKKIDAVAGVPSHMAIGEGNGTVADNSYNATELAEFQGRVATTRTNPGTRLTNYAGVFTIAGAVPQDVGAFAVVLSGTQGADNLFAVMAIDQISNVPPGAIFRVDILVEQRA